MVKDFSYEFQKKDRVGIVGANGVGKSSFLNLIAGRLSTTEGEIKQGETLVLGYYEQQARASVSSPLAVPLPTRSLCPAPWQQQQHCEQPPPFSPLHLSFSPPLSFPLAPPPGPCSSQCVVQYFNHV